jgi:uncharacterized protein YndB with AHSA1/START domain
VGKPVQQAGERYEETHDPEFREEKINHMEYKTKVSAAEDRQEILITREFELPVEVLFKAYTEPGLIEQWMGNRVLKLESRNHGSYRFETSDPKGNRIGFNGVIHVLIPNQRIVRTFEMENTPFGVQLEVYEFTGLPGGNSQLRMHVIYESVEQRDQLLKLPFRQGINMAHNRLEEIVIKQRQSS